MDVLKSLITEDILYVPGLIYCFGSPLFSVIAPLRIINLHHLSKFTKKISFSTEGDTETNMTSLEQQFHQTAEELTASNLSPSNEVLLIIYGLYKQSTIGDINIPQPSWYSVRARAKWDEWNTRKGMDKTEAMKKYIEFVKSLFKP